MWVWKNCTLSASICCQHMLTPQRAHCVHSRPLTQVSELGGGEQLVCLPFYLWMWIFTIFVMCHLKKHPAAVRFIKAGDFKAESKTSCFPLNAVLFYSPVHLDSSLSQVKAIWTIGRRCGEELVEALFRRPVGVCYKHVSSCLQGQ